MSIDKALDPAPQHHLDLHSDDEEEADCCRICRCGGSPGDELFYPCRCSGSIKYVHQSCLQAWLGHSGSTHCEVCKHKFVFTPVYAQNAPATLSWHELALGLVKRGVQGIKLAHRVWVVSCIWLVVVPWITCFAWRLAFLQSFSEVPRLLRERCNVLSVATDCIQGSLLSISIVFLNVGASTVKEQLKALVHNVEQQLLQGPIAPAPAAAVQAAPLAGTAGDAAAAAEDAAILLRGAEDAAANAAGVGEVYAADAYDVVAPARPERAAVLQPPAAEENIQQAATAAAARGPSSSTAASSSSQSVRETTAVERSSPGSSTSQHQQNDEQAQQPEHETQPLQQQLHEQAGMPAAVIPHADVGAVPLPVGAAAVVDADVAADVAALVGEHGRDDGEVWGDVPFEELLGLQGPWLSFLETIVLVVIGNAFFMAGAVYLPLNAGRMLLSAARRACAALTLEQQLIIRQAVAQHMWAPGLKQLSNMLLTYIGGLPATGTDMAAVADTTVAAAAGSLLNMTTKLVAVATKNATAAAAAAAAAFVPANVTSAAAELMAATATAAVAAVPLIPQAASTAPVAALSNITSAAASAAAASLLTPADPAGLLIPALDAEPVALTQLNFNQVVKELHTQLELPGMADLVALGVGHSLLLTLLLSGLWLYVSIRLWRAASSRVQRAGQQPLVQVISSTVHWLATAAGTVGRGAKLVLLLSLQLGAFPLAAGLWLNICALPLTASSITEQRELLAKTPVLAGVVHWLIGVGFLLGVSFVVSVARDVLRPGALPFLKDPANPERNPIQEMMEARLVKHLAKVVMSWVSCAGLCVVLVHVPALLARALAPSLYPLRVARFDPVIQIPADMLLLHIFIPFTVEHVRVRSAVRAFVHCWLQWAGRLLGWADYLLPVTERSAAAARLPAAVNPQPAAVIAAQPAHQQVQQQQRDGSDQDATVSGTGESDEAWRYMSGSSLSAAAAAPVERTGPGSSAAAAAAAAGEAPVVSLTDSELAATTANVAEAHAAPAAPWCPSHDSSTDAVAAVGSITEDNTQNAASATAPEMQEQAAGDVIGSSGADQQPQEHVPEQQQQQQQGDVGTWLAVLLQRLLVVPQQQPPHRPVQWYEAQPNYNMKLLLLLLSWLASIVVCNCLLVTVPVAIGRSLFFVLHLPWKNDLFTGVIGLIALSGAYSLAAGVATSANVRNAKAAAAAAWKWLVLAVQWAVLLLLWLGVVATMLGMLLELIMLPLRLPPNQTALIYVYQTWMMGVLALKLWHLILMVGPRREGRAPPEPESWQAHFEALQAGGLRNLDFNRALVKVVLPVVLKLATCLAVPYVITRGMLPLCGLPATVLQYASLYAYQIYFGAFLVYMGLKQLHAAALQLHNTIRDDRYLVGRQLNNYELQQQQQQQQEHKGADTPAEQHPQLYGVDTGLKHPGSKVGTAGSSTAGASHGPSVALGQD